MYLRKWHMRLTAPAILLSMVTGTANFGIVSYMDLDSQKTANYVIGSMSIFASLLGYLANWLRLAETMESHRSSALAWGKYHRMVSTELSLRRDQRSHCQDFVKVCRLELDRLIEQCPSFPQTVIADFNRNFKDSVDIHKPDICNGIEPTRICEDDIQFEDN